MHNSCSVNKQNRKNNKVKKNKKTKKQVWKNNEANDVVKKYTFLLAATLTMLFFFIKPIIISIIISLKIDL